MTQSTPHDAERSAFTRAALARLVMSSASHGLAEAATALAVTRFDDQTGPGGRASEAASVLEAAGQLLARAVIFEHERGSSWEDIARYLGTDPASARERFTPAIDSWHRAFEEPYRADETGRKRVRRLPYAAYRPEAACQWLDLSVRLRMSLLDDPHPVSGALRPGPSDTAPPDYDLGCRVLRRNLGRFLRLLAGYAGGSSDDVDETDWEAAAHVSSSAEDEVGTWDTHTIESSLTTLRVRVANVGHDGELVEVIVSGAVDAALRVRIDTLAEVLGSDV
ncbi:hypothetical protein [Yinghuangia soli]|uniref:Uncharacterized protein n=1 Tax=Yinghuangia soli TaxID=2908204 RepID=A0AA41U5E9_9ACTN|nr:hypothetical protein [Yinghuangia soli]MCF2529919.1 hypothetical protein [Yinghuangia soli]